MLDFETVTCSHLRLHYAQARVARTHLWLIIPLACGVFAVTAWWAAPAPAAQYAPLAALACLLVVAAGMAYALAQGCHAGSAARELSAFHNQVLAAREDHEEETPDDEHDCQHVRAG